MNGSFLKPFKLKFLTETPPLSAAAAKLELLTREMRDLAREANSTQTILSCIRLVVWDMVCPLHAPEMIWYCYSHRPIPGTDHTPSHPQIHSISDLHQRDKMFGFHPEELNLIERFFEATQKLNALAKGASEHYSNLYYKS